MTDITIPPEALEAAAKAIYEHWQFSAQFGPNPPPWVNGGNSLKQDQCRAYARAAFTAMVEAWPEMTIRTTFWPNDDGVWIVPRPALSLPLPQEKPDA